MPSPGEDIQSWSKVAANNGTADPLINWAEGQTRASVNNSSRSEMAAHAKNRDLLNGSIVTTGAANAQAFLSGLTYTAIPSNLVVRLKIGTGLTNTASVTLNMDGLGDTLIKTADGTNLQGGELVAGGYVDLLYNGTNWIFLYSEQFIDNQLHGGGGVVIGKQIFSTAGGFTYTPTTGMECCIIECIGPGGGGGGASGAEFQSYQGGGGGGGGYSRAVTTAAAIGASQAVTVGAAGTGGVGATNGTAGTATSVGSLCIANGGAGGGASTPSIAPAGGAGATAGTGDIAIAGTAGGTGFYNALNYQAWTTPGNGAPGPFGGGTTTAINNPGVAATGAGSGGSGGSAHSTASGVNGGNGAPGLVIVTEFAGRGSPGRDGATGPAGPVGPTGPSGAGTGDVLRSGTPSVGQVARWTDASHIQGVGSDTIGFGPPQGRLSLSGLVPVVTTTFTAATAIAYSGYVGDKVPIYDGINWTMTTLPGGFASQNLTDTSKNPAAIGANKVNDWFIWNDAGTIRLSHGPDWTNDTTRSAGTALTRVNGIWLNNVTITNACAASRGTYVGTTRSNGTSTLDWIFGTVAAGGTAAVFGVWNAYNRVPVSTIVGDSTDSWNYASTTWRAANASNAMRVSYVCGLQEDAFAAEYCSLAVSAGGGTFGIAIGYDSTSVVSGLTGYGASTGASLQIRATFRTTSLGYHFMQAIENAFNGISTTFAGDGGAPGNVQTGLVFDGRL